MKVPGNRRKFVASFVESKKKFDPLDAESGKHLEDKVTFLFLIV